MQKNKKRILITGVAGFIGSNLAERLLEKGYEVFGIDDLSYGKREQVPSKVKFFKLDIRLPEIYKIFTGIDYVFHLAAKNCLPDCQKDPVETSDINVTGTVNVFEASRINRVKKVIYAETSALYELINQFPTSEKRIKPESIYAISKLCNNFFAKAYQRFYGLTTTGLRYFNVYGPRQDYRRTTPPVMSAFIINLLKKQRPIIYGNGAKRRDFVYIKDVNDFHIMCLENRKTDNRIFNMGSGENFSILEIYELIKNMLHSKLIPLFKQDLEGEALITLAGIEEAEKIGWHPKTNLKEGLKTMIAYIKNEIRKGNIRI